METEREQQPQEETLAEWSHRKHQGRTGSVMSSCRWVKLLRAHWELRLV